MEKLKYLLANPYWWLFFAFMLSLPLLIKYIRRFYPKELQEKIMEAEACVLKRNKKPEIKRIQFFFNIGILFALIIGAFVAYLSNNILMAYVPVFVVILIFVRYEKLINKGKKDKNCSKIYTKREIIMQIGIYGGLVVLLFAIIVMFDIGKR